MLPYADDFVLDCVQYEKPSFLATKPAVSAPLARVNGQIIRRRQNSVFEVELSIGALLYFVGADDHLSGANSAPECLTALVNSL